MATRRSRTMSPARRARYAKRRAKRIAAQDQDLTAEQWAALLEVWGNCCAYCGTPRADLSQSLHKDCVLPVARGGRYTLDNVVPACGSCNSSKSRDEVTAWMRRKRLDEAAFLVAWRRNLEALVASGANSA